MNAQFPQCQWTPSTPPDNWCGAVWGRYLDATSDDRHMIYGAEFCKVRGWTIECSRDLGTSGGFSTWTSETSRHKLIVEAWLAVGEDLDALTERDGELVAWESDDRLWTKRKPGGRPVGSLIYVYATKQWRWDVEGIPDDDMRWPRWLDDEESAKRMALKACREFDWKKS